MQQSTMPMQGSSQSAPSHLAGMGGTGIPQLGQPNLGQPGLMGNSFGNQDMGQHNFQQQLPQQQPQQQCGGQSSFNSFGMMQQPGNPMSMNQPNMAQMGSPHAA